MFDKLPRWLLTDVKGEPITRTENCPADLLGTAVGISLAALEVSSHHTIFTLSNLVACLVAAEILQATGIRTFKTAGVLFAGVRTLRYA